MASESPVGIEAGRTPDQRKAEYLVLLVPHDPGLFGTLLAFAGFVTWVGAAFAFLSWGVDSEGRILRRHILRNALLPVITYAGIQAGQLIGGSILVETVFAWPGIGRLAFEALLARDYQVLLGVFLCTSVLVVLFNLATDLVYRLADPRMELS